MTNSRAFDCIVLAAAAVLALVIHSYYVDYYVSAHPSTFLSLKPIPAFGSDRKIWIDARKEEAVQRNFGYSFTEHKNVVNVENLQKDFSHIYATPLFLALRPSENITFESIGKAKERSFWLGCIVPLLIIALPALWLLRNHFKKEEPQPIVSRQLQPESTVAQANQSTTSQEKQEEQEDEIPWAGGSFTRDDPAVITAKSDYVRHEYSLARIFFEEKSLAYKLVKQTVLRESGRVIDALEFTTKHKVTLKTSTYILHFDVTRGYNSLVG